MIRINLLPVRVSRQQEAVRNELVFAGVIAAIVCVLLLMTHLVVVRQVRAVRADNKALEQEITQKKETAARVDELETKRAEYDKKLTVIRQLEANKSGPVHLLDQLSQATPEKLQLTSLDESRGRVQLVGVAVSNEVISQFLSNLEQSEYFEEVYLNAIDQVEKEGIKLKNFSITARLVVPGVAAEEPAPTGKGAGKGGG